MKIKQMQDPTTKEPIFPVTTTKAVATSDGKALDVLLVELMEKVDAITDGDEIEYGES